MSILAWIIVGSIAGWLAKTVVPGEGPGGIIGDLAVGIIGAFVGGWIFYSFGHISVTALSVGSMVVAFIGAVLCLWILRLLTRGQGRVRILRSFEVRR